VPLTCQDATDEKQAQLNSLQALIFPALVDALREQSHNFDTTFNNLLQTLPLELSRIIKSEFSSSLTPAAAAKGNAQRLKSLAKKAPDVARQVSKALVEDYVLNNILDVLHAKFHASFETICDGTHALFAAAVKNGETKDFERLQAFTISQHYSRFCAGMISAIHKSELEPEINETKMENLAGILSLADQPHDFIIKKGQGLAELFNLPAPMAAPMVAPMADAEPEAGWHCPTCGVHESQTNMAAAAALPLTIPCRHSSGCWCEAIEAQDRNLKRCKLCVSYFIRKHQPRPAEIERRRMSNADRKRKSDVLQQSGPPNPTKSDTPNKEQRVAEID
jgi:hypothetical protein